MFRVKETEKLFLVSFTDITGKKDGENTIDIIFIPVIYSILTKFNDELTEWIYVS